MSATELRQSALVINEQITDPDDERDHVVCCDDENVALCGVDLTGVPWVSGDGNDCEHCRRIEDQDGDEDECALCPLVALQAIRSAS